MSKETEEFRILVVDKNDDYWKECIRKALDDPSYKVSSAASVEEAVKLARQRPFNLAIISVFLRHGSPLAGAHELAIQKVANYIVIATAAPQYKWVREAMEPRSDIGAFDFIQKIYTPKEKLRERLGNIKREIIQAEERRRSISS